ncbi:glycosyltransferase family 4 protein [Ktedonobacter sp. SOSP1-52]|uniref:glycosyltransferase family 4 protein n=1 Tax=Ktedonobacter sp. SOSP1-52 TaxID=2778366 RepID=UPI0019164D7D|nr:glycosyltransferase family 4 protein [Ktedonobacter sp. SOSP1-52]
MRTAIIHIEKALAEKHTVLRMPVQALSSITEAESWLLEYALNVDFYLGWDTPTIQFLRANNWGGKVIFNLLGDLPRGAAALREALPHLYKTDAIWCVNSGDRQIYRMLVAQNGEQPAIVALPYGIDCQLFAPLEAKTRKSLRRELGLTSEDFVIVYAGRITIEKNVHALLEAMSYLPSSGAPVKLIIAGQIYNVALQELNLHEPDLATRLQQLIQDWHLSERVAFSPWLDSTDLNNLYNVADVFVNLTLHHDEQFGFAQVEAMSAGLPVIGTAWGGLKDTIVDSKSGFLIDTWMSDYGVRFDMPWLVNILQLLRKQRDLRQELGWFAVQHVQEHFAWPVYCRRLWECLNHLQNGASEKSNGCYTEFGSAYHAHFPIKDETSKKNLLLYPNYRHLPAPYYSRLVSAYTSLGCLSYQAEKALFVALPGKIEDKYFVSGDLLWQVKIPLEDEEIPVIQQARRYPGISRSELACSDKVIGALVKKGIMGISR